MSAVNSKDPLKIEWSVSIKAMKCVQNIKPLKNEFEAPIKISLLIENWDNFESYFKSTQVSLLFDYSFGRNSFFPSNSQFYNSLSLFLRVLNIHLKASKMKLHGVMCIRGASPSQVKLNFPVYFFGQNVAYLGSKDIQDRGCPAWAGKWATIPEPSWSSSCTQNCNQTVKKMKIEHYKIDKILIKL